MLIETKNGTKEARKMKFCHWCKTLLNAEGNFRHYDQTYDGYLDRCNSCERDRKKDETAAYRDYAIDLMGGCCNKCGNEDSSWNPLELDHVNNEGKEHRKSESMEQIVRRIADTGEVVTSYVDKATGETVSIELQWLCRDCHRDKTEQDFPGFLEWKFSQNRQKTILANANS